MIKSSFQNGHRHITASKNEVSRDLVVNVKSKKKQALLVGVCSYVMVVCYASSESLVIVSITPYNH
jgi:hypothetical protein